MNILVFGASGLLGPVLCQRLREAGHAVTGFRRSSAASCGTEREMASAFASTIERVAPECVINLIAATNVDQCESDMAHAALLNCFVPQLLVDLCKRGEHLIHVSSDQVYEGNGPHGESSVRPVNAYALTKFIGEYPVVRAGGCVLRTNFFGKSHTPSRTSLSDWLVSAGRSSQPSNVFEDVWFSPLGMASLSAAILRAVEMRLAGLFNVGAADGVSKAAFARLLFKSLNLDERLLSPVSINSVELKAPRPKDMRMDSSHFSRVSGFELPTVRKEIQDEAARYARP